MSDLAEGPESEDLRERVLAAAYDELTRWGIDRFSIVSLADRHGLDPGMIRRQWGNEERLVVEVLSSWPGKEMRLPDSGSLRTDLLFLAMGMARYVQSGLGRTLQVTHVIGNPHLPSAQIRRAVWRARASRLRIVVDRAKERGELAGGVDANTVLELLFAPINMRALFTGEPVDDDYCRTIADLVWHAVTASGDVEDITDQPAAKANQSTTPPVIRRHPSAR
jgi:AcrR family transcriptional regulator